MNRTSDTVPALTRRAASCTITLSWRRRSLRNHRIARLPPLAAMLPPAEDWDWATTKSLAPRKWFTCGVHGGNTSVCELEPSLLACLDHACSAQHVQHACAFAGRVDCSTIRIMWNRLAMQSNFSSRPHLPGTGTSAHKPSATQHLWNSRSRLNTGKLRCEVCNVLHMQCASQLTLMNLWLSSFGRRRGRSRTAGPACKANVFLFCWKHQPSPSNVDHGLSCSVRCPQIIMHFEG